MSHIMQTATGITGLITLFLAVAAVAVYLNFKFEEEPQTTDLTKG